MTTAALEAQLLQLPHDEKARIFGRLALDLAGAWPGIEKTAGVQGSDPCLARTRIPIWTLEAYRRLGWDDARMLTNFPTLTEADLRYAWLYVAANREEIAAALRAQQNEERALLQKGVAYLLARCACGSGLKPAPATQSPCGATASPGESPAGASRNSLPFSLGAPAGRGWLCKTIRHTPIRIVICAPLVASAILAPLKWFV